MDKQKLKKTIILVVIVLAVLYILWNFFLYPHQAFRHNEKILSEAGKRYFEINSRNLPTEVGRVSTVSLETLIKQKYLDELKIKNNLCDIRESNVKIKNESSGEKSYYTHLKCGSRHSNVDYTGPVIKLNGKSEMTINVGDTFTDPGVFNVRDATDGELKIEDVYIKGSVNSNKIGTYEITYTAYDSLENETTVTRTVRVVKKLSNTIKKATQETNNYYKGTLVDNYIMFNNMVFRILRVNKDNTVTIVSDSPLANIDYNASNGRFEDSNMDEWLNKYFYSFLNSKSKKLIVSSKWCDDVITDETITKTTCDRYSSLKKIGILSIEDYNNTFDENGNTYLNSTARTWYNNFTKNNEVWSIKSSSSAAYKDNILLNIKPALTLSSEIEIVSGTGEQDDPYIIGAETNAKRDMKVNKLDIGQKISYSGYTWVIAGKEDDGTTEIIMDDYLNTGEEGLGDRVNISYNTASSVKIYNPKEQGNIGYQISNDLSKYIDTSYLVSKEIEVPIYAKNVTYKGKHDTKTYKVRLSVPSVFEIFSGKLKGIASSYWLIDSSKEEENKTLIETDGTTPFYYRETNKSAGVRLRAYLKKSAYVKSDDCTNSICRIGK